MGRYLTPLPYLFASLVATTINRAAALDPVAPAAPSSLAGRILKFEFRGLGLELFITAEQGRLAVKAESDVEPDTVIAGTPAALLAMAVPDWRAPGSGVNIHGEADLARDFERYLRRLDPDWEAALTERFGEVAGHQFHVFFREGSRTGRALAEAGADQLGTWLREESGLLVGRAEMREFTAALDELREGVDRLGSRLGRERRA